MKFMPILMDLIPVDPAFEEEVSEAAGSNPELSTILLVAGAFCLAAGLITYAIKKNKK